MTQSELEEEKFNEIERAGKAGFWHNGYVRFLMRVCYRQKRTAKFLRIPMATILIAFTLLLINAGLMSAGVPVGKSDFWAWVLNLFVLLMVPCIIISYFAIVRAKYLYKKLYKKQKKRMRYVQESAEEDDLDEEEKHLEDLLAEVRNKKLKRRKSDVD